MTSRTSAIAPLDAARPDQADHASLAVVEGRDAAGALLDPVRQRVLALLREAGSATSIAAALGMSRQNANYHVRALEGAGLLEQVGHRQRRGLKERIVRATATRYLIRPDVANAGDEDPAATTADRFSASYLVAASARTIREVAALAGGARRAGKRLTTLTLDTEVRFRSPADRAAFADELVESVTALVARYHAPDAPDGRRYRLVAGAHPVFVPPASGAWPRHAPARQAGRRPSSRSSA